MKQVEEYPPGDLISHLSILNKISTFIDLNLISDRTEESLRRRTSVPIKDS